jgi:hypothetical protein
MREEMKEEGETTQPDYDPGQELPREPLFKEGSREGDKGNAQDEKDETEE